jgi:hypothetical protein
VVKGLVLFAFPKFVFGRGESFSLSRKTGDRTSNIASASTASYLYCIILLVVLTSSTYSQQVSRFLFIFT